MRLYTPVFLSLIFLIPAVSLNDCRGHKVFYMFYQPDPHLNQLAQVPERDRIWWWRSHLNKCITCQRCHVWPVTKQGTCTQEISFGDQSCLRNAAMEQIGDFTNNGTALGKACVPADLNKIYSSWVLDAEQVTCLKVSSYGGKARLKDLPRLILVIGIGLKPEITAKSKK